ncbi:MAG: hypothetical protein ABIQ86_04180 [Steroidobacteraceae bacterium]
MKKLSCLLVLATLVSSTAWAACKPPDSPRKVPEGATAPREEMLAGKKVIDQFTTRMGAYLECIKDEYEKQVAKYPKADAVLKKQFDDSYMSKNHAAMDEQQKWVDKFNLELAAFKARPK